jgi:septal ring factor EnvC (AmiA/AmiB activator)
VVNGSGKLGVVVSSARYKRDINDMGASTDGLMKLRPVTFVYKGDPQGVKQYGLVAEEVDKVYPELVVHDDAGKVESVRYSMLTSMLLNELQKETRKNEQQAKQIDHLTAQVARQQAAFEQRLAVVERIMAAQNSGGRLQAAFNR